MNEDRTTNETIKNNVFEFVKMCDIVGTIYTRNTTKSSTLERVGWPITQENFTEILKLNKHNNWEFQLNLEDMILSGTPDSLELVDYYYTNY